MVASEKGLQNADSLVRISQVGIFEQLLCAVAVHIVFFFPAKVSPIARK